MYTEDREGDSGANSEGYERVKRMAREFRTAKSKKLTIAKELKTKLVKPFGYENEMVKCPQCGNEQSDMGNNVVCEECDFGPIPTRQGR